MKINFTKKEYRTLVEMLSMADWVANAHRGESDDDPRIEKYDQLYNKICSHFKEMGCEDLIEHDKESNTYGYSANGEDTCESFKHIEAFEGNTFWRELIDRLASRDLLKQYSPEALKNMSDYERFEARMNAEQMWMEEVEKHGLERLARKTD